MIRRIGSAAGNGLPTRKVFVLVLGAILVGVVAGSAPAELTDKDVAQLQTIAARVNSGAQQYPLLASFLEREGPVGLAKALLARKEPDIRQMAVTVIRFHRLFMLAPELSTIADNPQDPLRDAAGLALADCGVSLPVALASVAKEESQVKLVECYGAMVGPLSSMGLHMGEYVKAGLTTVMYTKKYPLAVRMAAWKSVAGRVLEVDRNVPFVSVDEWRQWGKEHGAKDSDMVLGLIAYDLPTLDDQLRPYLSSSDVAARAMAAGTLVHQFHDASAIRVLVELLSRFGEGPEAWGDTGAYAFMRLRAIDGGSLVRAMVVGLLRDGNKELRAVVGDKKNELDQIGEVIRFLNDREPQRLERRRALGEAFRNWYNAHAEEFEFEIAQPQLRFQHNQSDL